MEFPNTLTIEGTTYSLVDVQRGGVTAIYKTDDVYLRIGSPDKIQTDQAVHAQMETAGFPVAQLLSAGTHNGWLYFIERSLGEHCFGKIFEREYASTGEISDTSWKQFLEICERFAVAQLTTRSSAQSWDVFKDGVHLNMACEEEPEYAELFTQAFVVASTRLSAVPFAVAHGDLTPFNMYPGGVIDLEDSFMGTAGYDLIALIEHLEWFPLSSNDALHQLYQFSPEQRGEFLDRIDAVYVRLGLSAPSHFTREFNFAKGIWFAVRLDRYPNLRAFRYAHLVSEAEKLLAS